ncbi:CehA/McbA family metallohydrolase [Streptomyces sp. NPDC004111]|uniref:CehA/McbA family metallohydrolase n=1 Tax=Streptomyces sp. NPDC004111 TaxID=3364690 RepID=UPI0036958116
MTSAEESLAPHGPAPGDRGRAWYRGDCHVHSTASSGGELSPRQLAADARAAGLDFLAVTEHNTAGTHGAWAAHTAEGPLVVLGQEATTRTGHWLALGIPPGHVVDWEYGVRDGVIGRHLDEVHRAGGLCVAAHPHAPYPSGTFMYPFEGFDLVEVWNGPWRSDVPWQADNEAALAEWGRGPAADLRRGRWRPAIGSSDTHLPGQLALPHTVVLADGLRTGALLAALRAGRSWIAGSTGTGLSLTAAAGHRTAGIGDRLATGGATVTVRAEVRGVPSGVLSLHTERGRAHTVPLPGSGTGTVEWETGAADAGFVRAEVRASDGGMAALSNPIVLSA